jgi:hypothetical protein
LKAYRLDPKLGVGVSPFSQTTDTIDVEPNRTPNGGPHVCTSKSFDALNPQIAEGMKHA